MARDFRNGISTNALKLTAGTVASGYVPVSDGQGNLTLQPVSGGGGSTYTPANILTVASSTATAAEKASANYVCDGADDQVEINNALNALQNRGGRVQLSGGQFNLSATIAFTGGANFADNPYVELVGVGADATTLAPNSGVHAITLTNTPKPGVRLMRINLSGASDGIRCIAPTTGSNDRRGFWMGQFEDLKIQGNFSDHSGWAINMESPFRSTFERIQGLGIKNGIWLKSHYSNFNPGNLTFLDCHMDLAIANGTAYMLESAENGGQLNLLSFIECDCIDSNSSSTSSIGWNIQGSTGNYYQSKEIRIISNVEQFNTGVRLFKAANIYFYGNYMDAKNNGTLFNCGTGTGANYLSPGNVYVNGRTINALVDTNSDPLKPNVLRDGFARVETGATLTMSPSSTTVIEKLFRDSDGAGVYPAAWQGATAALRTLNKGTLLHTGGTRSMNFVGSGINVTNSAGDMTVTLAENPSYDSYHQVGTTIERWYQSGRVNGLAATTLTVSNSTIYAVPFVISKPITLDRIGIRVTTAATSGTARMAIYSNNSDTNLYPTSLLVDTGQISTATAAAVTATVNTTLQPGLYWMCLNTGTAAPAVTALAIGSVSDVLGVASTLNASTNTMMTVSFTFGAFPSTFPAGAANSTTTPPMIAYRLSA